MPNGAGDQQGDDAAGAAQNRNNAQEIGLASPRPSAGRAGVVPAAPQETAGPQADHKARCEQCDRILESGADHASHSAQQGRYDQRGLQSAAVDQETPATGAPMITPMAEMATKYCARSLPQRPAAEMGRNRRHDGDDQGYDQGQDRRRARAPRPPPLHRPASWPAGRGSDPVTPMTSEPDCIVLPPSPPGGLSGEPAHGGTRTLGKTSLLAVTLNFKNILGPTDPPNGMEVHAEGDCRRRAGADHADPAHPEAGVLDVAYLESGPPTGLAGRAAARLPLRRPCL